MTQPPKQSRSRRSRSLPERRRGERRVLAVGLLLSVAVHLLALAIFSDLLTPDGDRPAPQATPVLLEPPDGMRVVDVRTVDDSDPPPTPEEPDEPESREDPEESPEERPRTVAAVGAEADSVPADDRTAADRLAPRVVDPRLWRPMILIPREPTLADVEARIAAAVEMLSDSALADAEAALRARDWTVEDESGGRWGVSPGQLHLGSVTLPLPIWFPEDPTVAAEQAEWFALDQQLERTRILESFEERVRAIRERRERERSEERERGRGDNGGG